MSQIAVDAAMSETSRHRAMGRLGGARTHLGLLAVAVAYVAVAVSYSLVVPLGETPDEPAHFDFVRYVATYRSLPIQKLAPGNEVAEGHQAPLYYILAGLPLALSGAADAPVYQRPNPAISFAIDGEPNKHALLHTIGERPPFTGFVLGWHVVRLFSVACGLLAVILAYAYAGVVFRGDRALMIASACLVGLNPQFAFISGAASNDALTTALGSALLLLAALALTGETPTTRRCALFGAVAGLAVLTKLTLAVPAVVAGLALVLSIWRARERWLVRLGLTALLALAVSGWWFARNLLLYGDLFALNADRAQNPSLVWNEGRLGLKLALDVFAAARLSYVARFGWMNIAPPQLLDTAVGWLAAAAAVGGALGLVRHLLGRTGLGRRPIERPVAVRLPALAFGYVFALAMFASQVAAAAVKGASLFQGRYMFAAAAAIAVLLVFGLAQLLGRRGRWPLALAALVGGVVGSLYCLYSVIAPSYPPPLPVVYDDLHARPAVAIGAGVGPSLDLVGLDQAVRVEGAKRSLGVTLYWRTLAAPTDDHTAFAHLVDASTGKLAAQSDHVPLATSLPPSVWRSGETILDTHAIDVTGLAAGEYVLHVGMYNLRDLGRLPVVDGGARADHVEVPIHIRSE